MKKFSNIVYSNDAPIELFNLKVKLMRTKTNVLIIIGYILLMLSFFVTCGSAVKRGIPVLMYHAVGDDTFGDQELFIRPSEFYKQMKYLADNGYTPITFEDAGDYYKYKKPVMITFDDGYRDVYFNAYPVLKKFNFKATNFLITGSINDAAFLTTKQIKEMSDITSFQSHTVTHPELDKLNPVAIEKECSESKHAIEGITGKPVFVLAYPHGTYNKNVIDIASKYYKYCVTTKKGLYEESDDVHAIDRIYVVRTETLQDFIKKVK